MQKQGEWLILLPGAQQGQYAVQKPSPLQPLQQGQYVFLQPSQQEGAWQIPQQGQYLLLEQGPVQGQFRLLQQGPYVAARQTPAPSPSNSSPSSANPNENLDDDNPAFNHPLRAPRPSRSVFFPPDPSTLNLQQLKALWTTSSLNPCSRIFQTIHIIFALSQRFGLLGNHFRIALKDSSFCFDVIDAIFSCNPIKAEQTLNGIISELLTCNSGNEIEQKFKSHSAPLSDERRLDEMLESLKVVGRLHLTLQQIFEKYSSEDLSNRATPNFALLAFAVGQIMENLPKNEDGLSVWHPAAVDKKKTVHPERPVEGVFLDALKARNEFAHGGASIDKLGEVGKSLFSAFSKFHKSEPTSDSMVL